MIENIFISAGDVSGDMHAARLVQALKSGAPGVTVTAVGGDRLKETADDFIQDIVHLGGFGFWSPVRLYFTLRALFEERIKTTWDARRPDRVVLVDYYGFNIHLAEEAHKRGIPVFYYVSPQVWASRPGRVRRLARYVTKMLVILPFEEELYRKAGVDAVFVGHPLLDVIPEPKEAGERASHPVIGLFPGSRAGVMRRHLPILAQAAELLRREFPDAQFKLFVLQGMIPSGISLPFEVADHSDYHERRELSVAVTTSGTVSLENALLGIPMVVFYRLSRFNYMVAKLLIRIPYITMVNILSRRMIVQEMIQGRATPEAIAREVAAILRSDIAAQRMRKELLSFRRLLGEPGVADRAAAMILA